MKNIEIPTSAYLNELDRIAERSKEDEDNLGVSRPADEILWLTKVIRKLKKEAGYGG